MGWHVHTLFQPLVVWWAIFIAAIERPPNSISVIDILSVLYVLRFVYCYRRSVDSNFMISFFTIPTHRESSPLIESIVASQFEFQITIVDYVLYRFPTKAATATKKRHSFITVKMKLKALDFVEFRLLEVVTRQHYYYMFIVSINISFFLGNFIGSRPYHIPRIIPILSFSIEVQSDTKLKIEFTHTQTI